MQQTTNSDLSRHYLPRQLRHLILQEYLSGVKTARQLSEEHGIPMSTIHKMGQRWKAKNSCSFVSTPNPYPIMSRVTSEEASELLSENKALRRRLEEALLRLEGYEIMGDILQEEYGIDLLKKSAAGQSSVSKKDTQQCACRFCAGCSAMPVRPIINIYGEIGKDPCPTPFFWSGWVTTGN